MIQVRGIIMDSTSDALGVYNLVVSELLHEGLTCALAAKRFGLLDETGACTSVTQRMKATFYHHTP